MTNQHEKPDFIVDPSGNPRRFQRVRRKPPQEPPRKSTENRVKNQSVYPSQKAKKTFYLIPIPVGLIIYLLMTIFRSSLPPNTNVNTIDRSAYNLRSGYDISSLLTRTASDTPVSTVTLIPTTGTITGKVLSADGTPLLVNSNEEEFGIVALFCSNNDKDVECLREGYTNMDVSVLISSICEIGDIANDCTLHLGQSAALIETDGSYTLSNVPPGQYEIVLIIVSSKIVLTVQLLNVEPIQAGKTTEYNFMTKSNEPTVSSNGTEGGNSTRVITPRPTAAPHIPLLPTATPHIPLPPTATPYIPMLRNPG